MEGVFGVGVMRGELAGEEQGRRSVPGEPGLPVGMGVQMHTSRE